ncbi:MAG: pyridoxal phosphate-dependent decarboxylase family protein [Paracoccaceae bacterium]
MPDHSLDPADWQSLRAAAHDLLDLSLDKMQNAREGRVWTPLPNSLKSGLTTSIPDQGSPPEIIADKLAAFLPFGVGNTHPRFFGWVHGAGNPGGILPEIVAAALNANLGGRDHGAIYVEKQVLHWCRQMMGFPDDASGLIFSGTSMATIIALKTARDKRLGFENRKSGAGGSTLTGYTSTQAHVCIARCFDLLGLGSDALRKISCNPDFTLNTDALVAAIQADKDAGLTPFVVIGTAGTVNTGAIDDLDTIANIAAAENLWYHIDGAFAATGMLSDHVRPKLNGLNRADSLAFDFHKWLHVNYDAGCVLIRDADAHRRAFADRPDYLAPATEGLAAANPWPVDYGPELSRGFRALKIWAHLMEHGTEKLGQSITQNCEQAQYLTNLIQQTEHFELLTPTSLNITNFRVSPPNHPDPDALNAQIVTQLQTSGIAAPSTTRLNGILAIRVNITNHRTTTKDLDTLIAATQKIAQSILFGQNTSAGGSQPHKSPHHSN